MLTDADLGYPAWRGFIEWAWSDSAMRSAFREETGLTLAADPIGIMIDRATGHDDAVAERFVLWATRNHYGAEFAPPGVQAALEKEPTAPAASDISERR